MPLLLNRLLITFFVLAVPLAHADEPTTPDAAGDEVKPDEPARKAPRVRKQRKEVPAKDDKIEVTGHHATDLQERRNSTAAKLVFGRDELDRYGDSTVGEMLKRLPGVTVAGTPGRGGDIRMRGLGSGYTQILINGESVPRGFSLDSLAPEQIERIEVIRAPVAEFSAQAIAGTINIVLREDIPKTLTEVRLSMGEERGYGAPNLSVLRSGKIGALNYLFSVSVFENSQDNQLNMQTLAYDPNTGQPTEIQNIHDDNRTHGSGVHMAPRLTYHFDGGDTLTVQPFVTQSHHEAHGTALLDEPLGIPPYANGNYVSDGDSSVARGFGSWMHKYDDGGKLTIKFGAGASHSESNLYRDQYNADGTQVDDIVSDSDIHDRLGSTGGKLSKPLGEGHTIALGWDGEWAHRDQARIFTDNGASLLEPYGNEQTANTRKLDVFAQDDWDVNAHWAAYAGLRWEGINTRSNTPGGEVNNTSSVVSPMLHAVYRLPDSEKDQVRFSLTRSYRAPSLSNLIALPSLAVVNTPTTPDTTGNPNLKPELAWGVDMAFEHYLDKDGILSANLFGRSIDNLMRNLTTQQANGRWLSQPYNTGHATTVAIELEAKAQLIEFFPNAPAVEFRTNYSHFWSNVEGIPGPNNRLDQQPKQTANLGFDYRLDKLPLTIGANLNWTPAFVVQSNAIETVDEDGQFVETGANQFSTQGNKRVVDMYALWKFSPKTQLRLAASNMLHQDYLTGTIYDGLRANQVATTTAQTYTTWTAKLEMKF